MKKFLAITLVVLLALSFAACGSKEKESDLQTYDSGKGLTVSMPKGFSEETVDGFTYFITSENSAFTALKETNDELASAGIDTEALTLKGYSEFVVSANALDSEFTEDENGNLCVSYNREVEGTEYSYYTVLKEGTDCYWVCNFFCFGDDEETFAKFSEWASTITVE